jgi:hypothetical protein
MNKIPVIVGCILTETGVTGVGADSYFNKPLDLTLPKYSTLIRDYIDGVSS